MNRAAALLGSNAAGLRRGSLLSDTSQIPPSGGSYCELSVRARVKDLTTALAVKMATLRLRSIRLKRVRSQVANDLHFLGCMTLPQPESKEFLWLYTSRR